MKRFTTLFVVLALIVLATTGAFAQVTVSGSTGADGSYATLTAAAGAFATINLSAQTGNTILITITADATAEDGANSLNNGGWTSLTINPSGGAARVVSGAPVGGIPLINLDGAKNVTIDGLNTGGNALTISNTTVSATAQTATIRFINDATNNTVQNTTILGSATGTSTANIIFGTTTGTTGNDNNTVTLCNIGPAGANFPLQGVWSSGTTTTVAHFNSGVLITNNNIFDFFNSGSVATGVLVAGGNTDWTISGNSLYQTASRAMTVAASGFIGISVATTTGNNFTVNSNFVGGSAASAGGAAWTQTGAFTHTFIGIRMSVGTTTPSNVQGNVVQNISISTASTSTINAAISFPSGALNIGTTTPNTIGSQSITGSITFTGSAAGTFNGFLTSPGTLGIVNISNNTVGGITMAGAGANAFFGINVAGSSGTITISGNTIGSATTANSITSNAASTTGLIGIRATNTVIPVTITNNLIANLQCTSTGTASLRGIEATGSVSGQTISGNTIRTSTTTSTSTNATTTAAMVGILLTGSTTSGNTISNNSIYDMSSTTAGATAVYNQGILITSTPSTTISRNHIYNLTTASTSATSSIVGIQLFNSSATENIYNNMIRLGLGVGNNPIIRGIYDNTASASPTNIRFNSIFITGTQGAATVNTSCINRVVLSTMDIRNNILWNNRASTGAPGVNVGRHYCINSSVATTAVTTDYNDLYADGNGGTVGFSTSDRVTLANWQAVASGFDVNSISTDPLFVDATNATTPNLHLQASNPESKGGVAVAGITEDFDGPSPGRPQPAATRPDIGADEGSFTLSTDLQAPAISYTNLLNSGSMPRVLTGFATVDDNSGTVSGGTSAPRFYYKKSTNANAFVGNTNADDGWKYVVASNASSPYDFTVDYTLLLGGSASVGDVINYFVAAQDGGNLLASNPAGASAGSNPPVENINVFAGTAKSYTITASSLAGDYTVGLTLFARVTGKSITFEQRTRMVEKEVPVEMAVDNSGTRVNGVTLVTNVSGLTQKMLVEETYAVPMLNGVEHAGLMYHALTPAEKVTFGLSSNMVGIYARVRDAVDDYNLRGVAGHTRFLLNDATYNAGSGETFPYIVSTANASEPSASATVTFQPNTGVVSTISGSSTSGIFVLADQYVKIDGDNDGGTVDRDLTVQNTGTGASSYVIGFFNLGGTKFAKNCTVRYTNVRGGVTAVATTSWGIILNGAGGDYDNALIEYNKIWQAFVGIGNYGVAATGINNDGIIRNNIIGDVTGSNESIKSRGIEVTQSDNLTITQNDVFGYATGNSNQSQIGVLLSTGASNITVTRNVVHDFYYNGTAGVGCFGMLVGANAGTTNIVNNFIHNIKGDGDVFSTTTNNIAWMPAGIAIGANSGTLNLHYNSIYMSGNTLGSAFTGQSACISSVSGITGVNLINNALRNSMGTVGAPAGGNKAFAVAAINPGAATIFGTINNNDYYSDGVNAKVGYIGALDRPALSDWQTATSQDLASVSGVPQFTSTSNLHVQTSVVSPLSNAGTFLAGAVNAVDYDGDTRSVSTPDIGGDEYTYVPPSVPDPTGVSATAISDTQIDVAFTATVAQSTLINPVVIIWNSTGTFTTPSGAPPSIGSPFAGGTVLSDGSLSSPVSHTGLSASTAYYYKAFSYDGGLVLYSPGVAANATTQAAPISSFPYTEGFEGGTFPPTGWTNAGTKLWSTGSEAHSGLKAARSLYNPAGTAILTMPPVSLPAAHRIKFWWKDDDISSRPVLGGEKTQPMTIGNDTTYFQISTNAGATWTGLDTLSTPSNEGAYHQVIRDLSAYGPGLVMLRWLDNTDGTGSAWGVGLDDIEIEAIPVGAPDTAGNVSPVNLATVVPITATLNWSAPAGGGTVTGYKLYFGTDGGGVTPPTNIVAGTNLGLVFTYDPTPDMLYSTTYYWQVVPTGPGGDAVGAAIWSFVTGPDPTISVFPHTQNFDLATPPGLAYGWTMENTNGDGHVWQTAALNPRSAPNAMAIDYNSAAAMDDWFFTPPLQLVGGTSYRVKFWYRAQSASYPEALELKWGSAATSVGMTSSAIFTNTSIANTAYQEGVGLFTPATSGIYYVGFHGISIADQWNLFVDDVLIEIPPPDVAPVIAYTPLVSTTSTGSRVLTATITDETAVDSSAGGAPRLWYRSTSTLPLAGAYTAITGSRVSPGSNDWNFTLPAFSSVTFVEYYVAAQDYTPNVSAEPAGTGYTSTPPNGTVASPNRFAVASPLTFTVGTTGANFPSITEGLTWFYGGIDGSMQFLLNSDYTSAGEVYPIFIGGIPGLGSFADAAKESEKIRADFKASSLRGENLGDEILMPDALSIASRDHVKNAAMKARRIPGLGKSNGLSSSGVNEFHIKPNTAATPGPISGTAAYAVDFTILWLDACEYVTIDGLTLANAGDGPTVFISDGASNNTIKNSTLKGVTGAGNAVGIVWFTDNVLAVNCVNNTIDNCTMTGNGGGRPYAGVTLVSYPPVLDVNMTIKNCTITDFGPAIAAGGEGIWVIQGTDGLLLENNNIYFTAPGPGFAAASYAGIFLGSGAAGPITNSIVRNNQVHDIDVVTGSGLLAGISAGSGGNVNGALIEGNTISNIGQTSSATTGVRGFYVAAGLNQTFARNTVKDLHNTLAGGAVHALRISGAAGGQAFKTTWVNNMITLGNVGSNGNVAYLGVSDNGNTDDTTIVAFNSIYIGGAATGGTTAAYNRSAASVVTLRNNILMNERDGGAGFHYGIRSQPVSGGVFNSDYNDVYVTGATNGVFGAFAGVDQATLTAWQTASGGDAASLNADPVFVDASIADLHVRNLIGDLSPVANAGVVYGGVTVDIDNETGKRATTPDIGADEFNLRAPLAFTLVSPANGATGQALSGTLTWNSSVGGTSFDAFLDVNPTPTTLVANVAGTSTPYSGLSSDLTYYWSVVAKNSDSSTTASNGPFNFATLVSTVNDTVAIAAGWNMISNPVIAANDSVVVLYPTSVFNFAYSFSGGYVTDYTMENGTGYWGKFASATSQVVSGLPNTRDTIDVVAGWNMVGSVSNSVDTSTIVSIPSGIRASNWFGYAAGYVPASSILPGQAYWVKSNAVGAFVLANPLVARPVSTQPSSSVQSVNDVLNSLTITDSRGGSQTLYFGADGANAVPVTMYTMPPMPPVGAFDARFETSDGGSMVQTHALQVADVVELPVSIQSEAYPLTITWKVNKGIASYELTDGRGGSVFHAKEMRGEGSMQITNSSVTKFSVKLVGDGSLPKEFSLSQNYPNPFNPTTNIKFALPVLSRVEAEIYNVLGQRVSTLVNGELAAGYHVMEWNGTGSAGQQVGSGTYFLKLSATGANGKIFTEVRKLLMLK